MSGFFKSIYCRLLFKAATSLKTWKMTETRFDVFDRLLVAWFETAPVEDVTPVKTKALWRKRYCFAFSCCLFCLFATIKLIQDSIFLGKIYYTRHWRFRRHYILTRIPVRMDILLDIWNCKDNRPCTQRASLHTFAGTAVDYASLFLDSEWNRSSICACISVRTRF